MPELGEYATTILSAYGAAIAILAVLIGAYLARNARIRKELDAAEARRVQGKATTSASTDSVIRRTGKSR